MFDRLKGLRGADRAERRAARAARQAERREQTAARRGARVEAEARRYSNQYPGHDSGGTGGNTSGVGF